MFCLKTEANCGKAALRLLKSTTMCPLPSPFPPQAGWKSSHQLKLSVPQSVQTVCRQPWELTSSCMQPQQQRCGVFSSLQPSLLAIFSFAVSLCSLSQAIRLEPHSHLSTPGHECSFHGTVSKNQSLGMNDSVKDSLPQMSIPPSLLPGALELGVTRISPFPVSPWRHWSFSLKGCFEA